MFFSFHASIGALIGCAAYSFGLNPFLAYSLSLFSHLAIDSIQESPDAYDSTAEILILDVIGMPSLLLIASLFSDAMPYLILCILFAVLPDIIDKMRVYAFKKKQIFPCHKPSWKIVALLTRETTFVANILAFCLAFTLITL